MDEPPSASEPRSARLVLVIAILSSFVAFLDSSVVNVALPSIARGLGGGLALQQWVVDGYLLTLGAFILLAGSLSDLFSRRRVLLVGLAAFGITSLACAAAPDGAFLIAARLVQGAAGALLVPSSLALIVSHFSGPAQARAIGRWTGWTSSAMIIGPLLGGILVQVASWRLVFAINVLPIAVTLALLIGVPDTPRAPGTRLDGRGAAFGALALGGVVFALIESASRGWGDPLVLVAAAVGCGAGVAFVIHERRAKAPMLPFSLFRANDFAVGNVATALLYGGFSLGIFVVGLYLQQVAGFSPALAGLAFLPPTVLNLLLAGRFGALAGRWGARWFMAAGGVVAASGFIALTALQPHVDAATELLPGVILFGLGTSIAVAPLTSAVLGSIDAAQAGIASAINNAVARVAGLVTVAAAALLIAGPLDTAGLRRALVGTAVLIFAGAVVSAIGIRDEFQKR